MKSSIRFLRERSVCALALALLAGVGLTGAQASFIIEVDTDGLDDSVLTYNPHFSFGGDTTLASQSISSLAYGMTGGDSIFGGNGVSLPDTYVFTYDPSVDVDNLAIPAYTSLGEAGFPSYASGLAGGGPGLYNVYATWPFTASVSGGPTRFTGSTAGDLFVMDFDQNNGVVGTGHFWYKVGEINWTSGPISVTMQPTVQNSYVSMRAAGMLFELEEAIPEPSTLALVGLGALLAARQRIRRNR